jgi:hypothetical protein
VLACVYFAGEELSWGQWYVGWETPQALRSVNRQGETNLHNISPWLDKKPRSLVELFILAAGLVAPLWLRARGKRFAERDWLYWILGPSACLAAAGAFTVSRFCKWFELPVPLGLLGDSEFRELWIAAFLSIYLMSYAARLAALRRRA